MEKPLGHCQHWALWDGAERLQGRGLTSGDPEERLRALMHARARHKQNVSGFDLSTAAGLNLVNGAQVVLLDVPRVYFLPARRPGRAKTSPAVDLNGGDGRNPRAEKVFLDRRLKHVRLAAGAAETRRIKAPSIKSKQQGSVRSSQTTCRWRRRKPKPSYS